MGNAPGIIRDSIVQFLTNIGTDASIEDITAAVRKNVGSVPASSVRSYLNLNSSTAFKRTSRGRYSLRDVVTKPYGLFVAEPVSVGAARLYKSDCFDWLDQQEENSIEAIVTDPPYGIVEYSVSETEKLRAGRGGVWRIPPSFDGHKRAPLPRFTTLSRTDRHEMQLFFRRFGALVSRVVVPGGNILVASNPLLAHIVAGAMADVGLELRGHLARQVMTMRGGDRPKNAHDEFPDVSVMPRSQWEPWVVLRKPLDGRVQDNLRRWRTGGFRRLSADQPFGDVIRSHPTPASERRIAPHPSLKPQAFMRHLVRAVLPLGEGTVVDPFMGAGSTLAAANAVGYPSIGIERDAEFFALAAKAIEPLSLVKVKDNLSSDVCSRR